FAGLLDLVRPLVRLLDAIPAHQAAALGGALGLRPPADVSKLAIGGGMLGLLAAAAEEQPLLCIVDDAQWLDAASMEGLLFAARRLETEAVALLFAARRGEGRSVEDWRLSELHVAGLSRAESLALLARSRFSLASAVAEQLHGLTGGNPLGLLEVPSALS